MSEFIELQDAHGVTKYVRKSAIIVVSRATNPAMSSLLLIAGDDLIVAHTQQEVLSMLESESQTPMRQRDPSEPHEAKLQE